MTDLRYTVSIQDAGEWKAAATFRWFNEAARYAKRSTEADKMNRIAVIEYDGHSPNYVQNGQLLYDLEDAS